MTPGREYNQWIAVTPKRIVVNALKQEIKDLGKENKELRRKNEELTKWANETVEALKFIQPDLVRLKELITEMIYKEERKYAKKKINRRNSQT